MTTIGGRGAAVRRTVSVVALPILAGVPREICSLCGHALPAPACHGACRVLAPHVGHVLDPFGGAGTVGLDATLIELNPEYAAMVRRRIAAGRAARGAAEYSEAAA